MRDTSSNKCFGEIDYPTANEDWVGGFLDLCGCAEIEPGLNLTVQNNMLWVLHGREAKRKMQSSKVPYAWSTACSNAAKKFLARSKVRRSKADARKLTLES